METVSRPVVLDARMIGHSGIGTHIRGLLEGWAEAAPGFRPTLLGDHEVLDQWLPEAGRYDTVPFVAPPYGLREQLAFPARETRGKLLHSPHYNIPLRHAGPLVVTIHDLIHLDPRWGAHSRLARCYARRMLRLAVRRARHIIAVSRTTARALAEQLAVPPDKITVVYNAPAGAFLNANPAPGVLEQFRRENDLAGDYLLTVGLYKPHKNLDRLFEAFRTVRGDAKTGLSLVVAGTQEKERPALHRRLEELALGGAVRLMGRIPAGQLPLLYGAARALIHPALLEGFGLPLVEAQAVGTPVVASRASAVPEIAGEGALYFDPLDAGELARQIVRVLNEPDTRARLAAEGRRNVRRFSWAESARRVLAVYARAARTDE